MRAPVAAFHEHLGLDSENQLERSVFLEPNDEADRFECRDDRRTIRQTIDRTIIAFAEPPHRFIGVERDDEARPERAGLREAGDVAAVENIEYAIGEYQGALERCRTARKLTGGTDLSLEFRGGVQGR